MIPAEGDVQRANEIRNNNINNNNNNNSVEDDDYSFEDQMDIETYADEPEVVAEQWFRSTVTSLTSDSVRLPGLDNW